ncbi:MAG: peptidase M48, partial [Gammaproteobacteria bacterium]
METQRYEALIANLEQQARERPASYLRAVVGVALLGFLILGVALGLSAIFLAILAGMGLVVIATGGKALFLL